MTSIRPVRKAVFPVAGLGTRFLPATKAMPKEMLTLNDRPLIQHAVEEARAAGIEDFIFITGRHKNLIEEHFDHQPELIGNLEIKGKQDLIQKTLETEIPDGHLFITRQQHPLGLGHAIWCAKEMIGDEPFAVILPDDVVLAETGCLSQMMEAYQKTGGNMMAVENVPREETYKYGVLDIRSEHGKLAAVKGLVEKPRPEDAPSTLSIIGRYILQPEIFEHLSGFEKGAGGEIQLTDAIAKMVGRQPLHGFRFDGTRYDCGNRLGFIEANIAYGLADHDIGNDIRRIIEKYSRTPEDKESAQHAHAG